MVETGLDVDSLLKQLTIKGIGNTLYTQARTGTERTAVSWRCATIGSGQRRSSSNRQNRLSCTLPVIFRGCYLPIHLVSMFVQVIITHLIPKLASQV